MGTAADRTVQLPADVKLPERYVVRSRIAAGGMASVWCAEDRLLGRAVAIKLLSEPYVHDAGAVLRFKREARAAARLSSHVNVVTIFDVGETTGGSDGSGGRAFIVMAYLAGGTVADALQTGEVDRTEALRWVREAAAALDYAHEHGVVHRDIKPANLLLDRGRVLHVADFGIARIATETPITQSGEVLGTAAYLSPERAFGEPATEASDRYSLAVVAFELLAGKRPFEAVAHGAQLRQHAEQEVPAASQIDPTLPPAVDSVLSRGMAKRSADRWPTAAAFAAALEEAATAHASPLATKTLPITVPVDEAPNGRAARPPAAAPRARTPRPYVPAPQPREGRGASAPRVARGRRSTGRLVAFATLAAVVLAVALVAFVHSGGSAQSHGSRQAQTSAAVRAHSRRSRPQSSTRRSSTTAGSTASTTGASTTGASTTGASRTASGSAGSASSASSGTQVASTAPPQGADALNAQGYQLMQGGNYAAAIPYLRRAIATSHQNPTYAYALYNLGRSLFRSGNPAAAIPILQQRMQIPIELDTVRSELQQAEQAAGITQPASGGPAPSGPDNGHHKKDKSQGGG